LGKLFHSHPEMAVTHEFGNLQYVGLALMPYIRAIMARVQHVDTRWGFVESTSKILSVDEAKWLKRNNQKLALRYLLNIARATVGTVDYAAIEKAMKLTFPEASVVGDKLPQYSRHLDKYVGQSGLACVNIYRDCRDMTSSFLVKTRTDWAGQPWLAKCDTATKIAARWVRRIDMMERLDDQLYNIRYEELMTQPQKVLGQFGEWVQIDSTQFDIDMIQPTSIGNYKQGLTQQELAEVMAVAGPTMARLGYI